MRNYLPEGRLLNTPQNKYYLRDAATFEEAKKQDLILESHALMCDPKHDLIVELPFGKGIIPRSEGAIGIEEGSVRDIALLSRVNKTVCFKIMEITRSGGETAYILSRRKAQEECRRKYTDTLKRGDVIPARITHLEPFGCFVDIGCGIVSLIPIDSISVSRIAHPCDRFFNWQDIFAVVKDISQDRITLSHKELLGTWEQNAALFHPGDTVGGIIRSVEEYGVFVELTPNLAGLAEPQTGLHPGQSASVYIKAIIPDRMKVKLIIIDVFENCAFPAKYDYFVTSGHMDSWIYSTSNANKYISTEF